MTRIQYEDDRDTYADYRFHRDREETLEERMERYLRDYPDPDEDG
jgi:hypothetical protein